MKHFEKSSLLASARATDRGQGLHGVDCLALAAGRRRSDRGDRHRLCLDDGMARESLIGRGWGRMEKVQNVTCPKMDNDRKIWEWQRVIAQRVIALLVTWSFEFIETYDLGNYHDFWIFMPFLCAIHGSLTWDSTFEQFLEHHEFHFFVHARNTCKLHRKTVKITIKYIIIKYWHLGPGSTKR